MWLTQHITRSTNCQQFLRQLRLYMVLSKARLSFFVALSALMGYLFASSLPQLSVACCVFIGGWLLSVSASTVNQWIEKSHDKHMSRTQHRPLPTRQLSETEALIWATTSGCAGLLILYFGANLWTALLSLAAFLLYVCAYTPLKRLGPVAVLVGALPGAMPPLLGCVAAENALTHKALLLFGVQFMWQFPHFWAIAWLSDKDYQRAGFRLLPGGKQDTRAASHIMLYSLFMIPVGLLPTYFGACSPQAAWIVSLAGLLVVSCALRLLLYQHKKAALSLMFSSLLYLPLVQIVYIFYKI